MGLSTFETSRHRFLCSDHGGGFDPLPPACPYFLVCEKRGKRSKVRGGERCIVAHILPKAQHVSTLTFKYLSKVEAGEKRAHFAFMFKLLIYCALLTQAVFAVADGPVFAPSIDQCPKLNKRPKPSSVHDLRPDDIEVVAAIGDR